MRLAALLVPLSLPLAASTQRLSGLAIGRWLARRQVSIAAPSPLPTQCASPCGPVNNEVSLGCPAEACCTTAFETHYYACLGCIGSALDAGNYSIAQNSLNLLWTTCVDMGFVLPRMELPGQSNSSNATSTSAALFPTGGSSASSTGAAVDATWRSEQVQTLIGAALLLGIVGLW